MDKLRLTERDKKFFDKLYSENYSGICKYISVITNDRLPCDDIAQEVFIIALQKIKVLETHANPVKWLYITAKNIVMNNFKRKMTFSEIPTPDEKLDMYTSKEEIIDSTFSDYENILTPEELYILKRHFIEGYSIKEISEEQSINRGTGTMRFSRIYKKIRKIFL